MRKRANATITSVVICLAITFIMCVAFEYIQMLIISNGIKNAIQSAVVSSVVANYDEAYSQLREGYSGDFVYSDKGFKETIDTENVMGKLDETLGLTTEGDKHIKYKGDNEMEFSLSNFKIQFENTKFAQGNASKNLTATVYTDVEMPLRFGGRDISPIKYTLKVMAEYMPKF